MSTSKEENINQRNADGEKEGWYHTYYTNGQLCAKGNLKNGLWKSYHINGKLGCERNSVNGKPSDWCKWYDEEGKLTKEIFYVNI